MKIIVHKKDIELDVRLLKHKGTEQYSFVNLTRGHICPCVFASIEDAMKDLEERKTAGKLESYEIMKV